jgi:N-acetylglucosaminyl-diphospho-decaprenol L-rhamnosyltransferase
MSSSVSRLMSVVFVSYNSANSIGPAIQSVRKYLPDAEILVVDNGSVDQSCSIVREFDGVRLLSGHGNIGFGAGVNLAARSAAGELLIVLNPDTEVTNIDGNGLSDLVHCPSIGIRGCLLVERGRTRHLRYSEWNWRGELCWLILQWFLVPREITLRRPRAVLPKARPWVSGAAFVVSRTEFLELGGFDEGIFLYFEDMDLSCRYRQRGARIGTTDAIWVAHEGQGSSHGDHERIQGWALLSFLEMVAKRQGRHDGEGAARAVLRLLNGVSAIARLSAVLPVIGPRASVKARSAAFIRSSLLECVDAPPAAGAYPRARASLAAVVRTSETSPLHGPS